MKTMTSRRRRRMRIEAPMPRNASRQLSRIDNAVIGRRLPMEGEIDLRLYILTIPGPAARCLYWLCRGPSHAFKETPNAARGLLQSFSLIIKLFDTCE